VLVCVVRECRSKLSVVAYETLRVPVKVMRILRTDSDSGLVRTSFPRSSVSCDSEDSP
jgi:hypothetical protein